MESKLFYEFCQITGIHKTRTTPFHPVQTERMNRTVFQMLRTSITDHPQDWPHRLPALLAAYRMSPHKTTSVSPNMAMMGREVLFPCSLIAATPEEAHSITRSFVCFSTSY